MAAELDRSRNSIERKRSALELTKRKDNLAHDVNRDSNNRYSDDDLLQILKAELNRNPEMAADKFNELGRTPSLSTYTRHFGSWNKARKKAGLGVERQGRQGSTHIICQNCGDSFKVSISEKEDRTHCSRPCMAESYSTGSEVECDNDGCESMVYCTREELTKYNRHYCGRSCHLSDIRNERDSENSRNYPSERASSGSGEVVECHTKGCNETRYACHQELEKNSRFFCSRLCYLQCHRRRDGEVIECNRPECNNTFYVFPSDLGQDHHFCSIECRSWLFTGERNPRWRDGYSFEYGDNWRSIRQSIVERDNHTCQRCGISKEDLDCRLDVHHIVPFRQFTDKEEANQSSNLIALCRSCHATVEHWPVCADHRHLSDNISGIAEAEA